jgi:hypothetical protein
VRLRYWVVTLIMLIICTSQLAVPSQASVAIAPARLEAVIGPDGSLPPLSVMNRGQQAVRIRFSLAGGGHDLFGAPVLNESEQMQVMLSAQLQLQPSEVYLGPGESQFVSLQAQPLGSGGLYPIIVAEIIPEADSTADAMRACTRIAIPTLLTYQSGWSIRVQPPALSVSDVHVAQDDIGNPLVIRAIVRNEGDIHARLAVPAMITGPNTCADLLFPPVTILPGAARQVQVEWAPAALPAGEYSVSVLPAMPSAGVGEMTFTVINQYELAQPRLELAMLDVPDLAAGSLPVKALVVNHGNVAGSVHLSLTLINNNGQQVAAHQCPEAVLPPGVGYELSGVLPLSVRVGQYYLQVQLWHNASEVARQTRLVQVTSESILASGQL